MTEIGNTLREARLAKGLTLDEVAQDTRISAHFLDALEAEAFDELPAPVYVRGFLRSYANYLRIDPQPLLDDLTATDATFAAPAGFAPPPSLPPPADTAGRVDPFAPRREATLPPVAPIAPPAPPPGHHERSRREGILAERQAVYAGNPDNRRVLAWIGAGAAAFLLLAFVGFSMLGGGGGDDTPALAASSNVSSPEASTIIAVGTRTAEAALTGTPLASPSGTPRATGTPRAVEQVAGVRTTAPTPTAEDTEEEDATALPAATATPLPPTSTPPPPPTATPVPPTATPVVVDYPSSTWEECGGSPASCSWPATVVCGPAGPFVDAGGDFYNYNPLGWTVRVIEFDPEQGFAAVLNAC